MPITFLNAELNVFLLEKPDSHAMVSIFLCSHASFRNVDIQYLILYLLMKSLKLMS